MGLQPGGDAWLVMQAPSDVLRPRHQIGLGWEPIRDDGGGPFWRWRRGRPRQRQAHWRREGHQAARTGRSGGTSRTTNQDCQRPRLVRHGSSTAPLLAWTPATSHGEIIGHHARASPNTPRHIVV